MAGGGRADRRVPRRADAGGGAHPHGRLRPLLLQPRRATRLAGVRRVPLLPPAQPGSLARPAREAQGVGVQRGSLYFSWAYHSPAPGVFDFSGVRDVDRLLDIAQEVGLYVIARPGPYVNAELGSGGYPAWLTTQAGRARTNADDYQAAWEQWFSAVNRIIARHQFTDGRGPVILYQIDNEYDGSDAAYMEELKAAARRDGITVPLFHNDKGRNLLWSAGPARRRSTRPTPIRPASTATARRSPASPTTASCATAPRSTRRAPASATARSSSPSSRAARSTRGAARAMTAAVRSPDRRSSGCSTPTTSRTNSRRRTSTWPMAGRTGAGRPTPTSSTPPMTTAPRSVRRGDSPKRCRSSSSWVT